MDKHDLGPYKDNTVSVLVNDFQVVSDPQMQPDVPHTGWIGPTGPLPFSSDRTTTSATTASAPPNADAISMDDLAVDDREVSAASPLETIGRASKAATISAIQSSPLSLRA